MKRLVFLLLMFVNIQTSLNMSFAKALLLNSGSFLSGGLPNSVVMIDEFIIVDTCNGDSLLDNVKTIMVHSLFSVSFPMFYERMCLISAIFS